MTRRTRRSLAWAAALAAAHVSAPWSVARAEVTPVPYGIHVVRPGETLFVLALRYRMRVADLAATNGMPTSGLMLPGRSLRVPLDHALNAQADAPAALPPPAATPDAVADRPTTDSAIRTIVVQVGDTLSGIAASSGLPLDDIRRWNGLPLDGTIFAGQTLVLEGGSAPAPEPVALASGRDTSMTTTVTVAPGDTLTSIGERVGTTAMALARLNRIEDEVIYAGQVLEVPRDGAGFGAGGSVGKRIEVDIGEQRMYVWEGQVLVHNWTISTGLASHPTQTGSFAVQSKVPTAWSSAWELWMPSWLGIYWAGGSENGIHALPVINDGTQLWAGFLGSPISYGCVVLGTAEAAELYAWADIGTPVEIHD